MKGTLGFAVLRCCGIGQLFLRYFGYYNLEMRCGGIRTCEMQFFSISDVVKNYPPSPPTFSEPFPVYDWTFPMRPSSHGNRKLQFRESQS